jgi:hypothetical protein
MGEQYQTFIVCRMRNGRVVRQHPQPRYKIHILHLGETWLQKIDPMTGILFTAISKKGTIDNRILGEFCGEFCNRHEAKIALKQLEEVSEVMDS